MHTFPSHVFLTYILYMVQIHGFDSRFVFFFLFLNTSIFHSYAFITRTHTFLEHLLLHKYFTSPKLKRSNPDYFHHPSFLFFSHASILFALPLPTHTSHISKSTSSNPKPYIFFLFFHLTFSHALHHYLHTSHVFFL